MKHPRIPITQARDRRGASRKALWLGGLAALLARVLHRRRPSVTTADLRKHDFPTSTQRLGVRFTERIRQTFRFRWLRKTL